MSQTLYVGVYLDQSLQKALDYEVPVDLISLIKVGVRVEVPLRNGSAKGTVAFIKQEASFPTIRPILKVLSMESEFSDKQWKLAEWMSQYYATSLQKVFKCFIPPHVRRGVKERVRIFVSLEKNHEETLRFCSELRISNPKQADVLSFLLEQTKGAFLSEILEKGCSRSSIDSLQKKKWIKLQSVTSDEELILEEEFFPVKPKTLHEEQRAALLKIEEALDLGTFSSHLIYGVTGSGKTEIYLRAIEKALSLGKGAMLLVPEVALTSQTIERFRSRFSEKIAILHHKRSLGERSSAWEELKSGKIQIVIGARSAVFAPIQNLGLIIVDEEHDSSYKQTDEQPCYHGRDVAVMRAYIEKSVVLLGSATPSIESRYNAEMGKYSLHVLRKRASNAKLPKIEIIDMKRTFEKQGGFTHFSPELLNAIKERAEKGEQTLLLLNRRGYHRMQICLECRTVAKCPHCDLSLTYHRQENYLKCHLCNYTRTVLAACPECKVPGSLEFKGFGTEHVERSLKAIFPSLRTLRMDKDTTSKKMSHEELFQQFRSHKADVLIGTQMIAKGFHFPSVTLVGVLNLDASLTIPDFRSPEQVFQLLIQVAGRAGRADLPGEVFLQTFLPDHPVIQMAAKQDYDPFYESTLEERRLFQYPPFCHFIKCEFSSLDPKIAEAQATTLFSHLCSQLPSTIELFPVAPSGHPKIKDLYRFQFLIKTPKISLVTPYLRVLNIPSLKIDVDPLSTFF